MDSINSSTQIIKFDLSTKKLVQSFEDQTFELNVTSDHNCYFFLKIPHMNVILQRIA